LACLAGTAFAGNSDCSQKSSASELSYINLKTAEFSKELKDVVREARKRVKDKKNLGYLPTIRRTNLNDLSDIKFFVPGETTKRKNAIAFSSYRVDGKILNMSYTKVKKGYRNMGLSELLGAEILAAHPDVTQIHIRLEEKNLAIFDKASRTMNIKNSIRETYSYKRWARLGFSKIVDAVDKDMESVGFLSDDEEWQFVEDPGGVTFTLRRPR